MVFLRASHRAKLRQCLGGGQAHRCLPTHAHPPCFILAVCFSPLQYNIHESFSPYSFGLFSPHLHFFSFFFLLSIKSLKDHDLNVATPPPISLDPVLQLSQWEIIFLVHLSIVSFPSKDRKPEGMVGYACDPTTKRVEADCNCVANLISTIRPPQKEKEMEGEGGNSVFNLPSIAMGPIQYPIHKFQGCSLNTNVVKYGTKCIG